jgi:cytochrome P450
MSDKADAGDACRGAVVRASLIDMLGIFSSIMLPTFGKGILIRRPTMVAAAQRMGFDSAAVKTMQRLRRKHGLASLLIPIPGRPQLLLLDPRDVANVLNHTPTPFRTDTNEKRAALNHFEPGNVLVAEPARRAVLRPLHEAALSTSNTVHPLVSRFREVIREEYRSVMSSDACEITWALFANAWFRVVRRIVLGDGARDDEGLTKLLNRLRSRANWAFFLPQDRAGRRHLHQRLQQYLTRAETGSLASMMPADPRHEPSSQIAQWLFAFDPAGMTTFRTLALLTCHRQFMERAREEALNDHTHGDTRQSFTRRCVLEALRLWPTTPVILRETTEDVSWNGCPIKSGTGLIIFTPFFGRDDEKLEFANKMAPEIWERSQNGALAELGITPFSSGPAICPAHNLVPLVACLVIKTMLADRAFSLIAPKLDPGQLPGTLNHFEIRLGATALSGHAMASSER